MAKLKGKTKNIAYSLAYKAAVDLVVAEVAQFDTEDVGAELAELADTLFEHMESRLDQESAGGGRGKARGGGSNNGRSRSSGGRGSGRGGSSKPRKPSGKQLAYLADLLRDKDHELDFEEDGDDILSVDGKDIEKLSGKDVSDLIEELKFADDL